LRFALAADPTNADAIEYSRTVAGIRAADAPTLPSSMALELRVNPFLRCDNPNIRAAAQSHAGKPLREPAEVFGALRAWKDQFR
jgi:hydroxyacylglutathione hydrolase